MIFINNISAQHYYFDQYSVKEGLAQSKVYSLIQDSDGYIWLGTASGVSRFDGINFENFSTDHGIAENGVRVIFEDKNKNIWLGHIGGGLTRFSGNKFQEIVIDTLTINGDITSITEDNSGNIWIGSHGNGAFMISNSDKDISEWKIKHYTGQQKLSDRVFQILKTHKGKLLFIIDGGIKQYIKEQDSFEFYFLKGIPQYFQFTNIYEDTNENLWIGTYNGGLYKWNKKTNTTDIFDIRDGLSSNFISTINSDKNGNIWIGTWGGGINRLNNKNIKVYNTNNGLVDNEIRCIVEDREGNILIGLNENGLAIFKGEQFISYTENDGLVNNQVSSIFQDNTGQFWFGTNSGVSILSKSDGKQAIFSLNELIGMKNIFKKEVLFINEDNKNNIWIATKEDGIYSINKKTKKIDYNPKLNFNVSRRGRGGLVTGMTIDKENALWIGTIDGIIYYDLNTGALANLSNIHGISGNDISALFCDSKNNIWIGSKAKGITKVTDTLFRKIKGSRKLTVKSFTEDKNGKIWIGTESQGIFSIVADSLQENYRMKDGLLADYITLVKCDNINSLWIGTNRGLNRLNFENKIITEFSTKSGFTGIEVKDNASILDSDGNLWFGTVQGVFEFIQKNEHPNNLEPLTHITKLTVNLKDRELIPNLVLNYPEKSIIFHYNSICLTNPEKVMYQVMLEGADEDWQPPTKQTFANYSPLPAGNYTFKVRASNNYGIWNTKPVTFHFIKKPPFWETKLFYFIVIVILIVILVLFIKIRERSLILSL
ncbi:MAG: hypothetical protein GXO79_05480, partial [Chlorobi bacterium]|nr:hypothetical protein [Chlorobiota bacterium]